MRGLTQEDAASGAGVTRNTITKLESEQFPDPLLSTLIGLQRVYEVGSLEELLGSMPSARLANDWSPAAAAPEASKPRRRPQA